MPGADVLDDDTAFIVAPYDFRDREAFADRVEKVGLDVLKVLNAVDLLRHELGDFLVPVVV